MTETIQTIESLALKPRKSRVRTSLADTFEDRALARRKVTATCATTTAISGGAHK
jgi:hypothetical protein